jgi:hypothetical protein
MNACDKTDWIRVITAEESRNAASSPSIWWVSTGRLASETVIC